MRTVWLLITMGLLAAGAAPVLGAAPKAAAADDSAMLQRLARVSGRITAAARQEYPKYFSRSSRRLTFGLAWDETLDAMSVPEGRVTISSGMMQALAERPDDELAAVLAHETVHIMQRHHGDRGDSITLRAAIEAAHGDEEPGRRGSTLVATRYSLNDEYRADAGTVKLLQAAGYDPGALSSVLKLLKQRDEAGATKGPAVAWFVSHPEAAKRIESADRVVAEIRSHGDSDEAGGSSDEVKVVR